MIAKTLFTNYLNKIVIYLNPVIIYWKNLNERERKLISLAGILLSFIITFFIISGLITWKNNLIMEFTNKQKYLLEADFIYKQYKDVIQTSNNEFSTVKTEQIRNDITNLLDNKNANITLENNSLFINVDNARFDSIMLLLDQFRKTYGIFPDTLKITKISPEYASLNASFIIYEK
ncbi:MAG TPA: type II secretion system protein GspM [Burkholderiales bacterium]|nr:type II secretion system protein GspM [Burkholderiales bacterium]